MLNLNEVRCQSLDGLRAVSAMDEKRREDLSGQVQSLNLPNAVWWLVQHHRSHASGQIYYPDRYFDQPWTPPGIQGSNNAALMRSVKPRAPGVPKAPFGPDPDMGVVIRDVCASRLGQGKRKRALGSKGLQKSTTRVSQRV
jgi:hypothetical protein